MVHTVIYVDSDNGQDSQDGKIQTPVRTLSKAYEIAVQGAVIVLQDGDGTSYGNILVSKSITIRNAYGTTPKVGSITVTAGDCLFEGLSFENGSYGIKVDRSSQGAVSVKECNFYNVLTAIKLNGVNYINVDKNTFRLYQTGIKINLANEVNISSNVFYEDGFKAVEVLNVGRIDLWRNTIHGARDSSGVITPDENLRIIYHTVTAYDISDKRLLLPGFATTNTDLDGPSYTGYDIAINVVEGPSFEYGQDYVGTANGSMVSWSGYQLENNLMVGDILRVMYSEDVDPGGGEAIRVMNVSDSNSTIDSNNIGITEAAVSDVAIGVFFNTALKIRYNNFFRATTWWNSIATPTNSEGNFSSDPKYTNATGGDFRLLSTSPDIDRGDPKRWDNIFAEMGIGVVNGHYTGIGGATRTNVAPFDRDIDRDTVHRIPADKQRLGSNAYTGDVGAYEYITGDHTGDYHINEDGYDRAYYGSQSNPFLTLDRGFDPSLADQNISINTNLVPVEGSTGASAYAYGRYRSKNMDLSARSLKIGRQSSKDIIYVTPSYPAYDTGAVYVGPDGYDNNPISGDGSYTKPYRTITRALQETAQNVMVMPGIYPEFEGELSKRLIGIPVTKTVTLPWQSYKNQKRNDWNTTGTVSFSSSLITLTGTAAVDSWDQATGKFSFSGETDASASILLGTEGFVFKIFDISSYDVGLSEYTVDHRIELQKFGTSLKTNFKVNIGGVYYTFSNTIALCDFTKRIRIRISIKSGKIVFTVDGKTTTGSFSKSKTVSYTHSGSWGMLLGTETTGSTEVRNLYINADSFTSTYIEVSTSTHTRRKIYAIQGAG